MDLKSFESYILSMHNNRKKIDATPQMKKSGYPMPKLGKLIDITSPKDGWKRLERFMAVNGEKINKSYPKDEIVTDRNMCSFVNGSIIDKTETGYIFTTYTVDEKQCVVNHQSVHTNDKYGLISGYVNYFPDLDHFDGYGDGEDYVNEILDILIKKANNNKNFWDLVQ